MATTGAIIFPVCGEMDSIHAVASSKPSQFDWDELILWISAACTAVGETLPKVLKPAHDTDFEEVVLKLDLSCGEFYIHTIEETSSWAITEYVASYNPGTLGGNGDPGDSPGDIQDRLIFPSNEYRTLAESFATLIARRRLEEAMFGLSEDKLEKEQLHEAQRQQFIVHRKGKE